MCCVPTVQNTLLRDSCVQAQHSVFMKCVPQTLNVPKIFLNSAQEKKIHVSNKCFSFPVESRNIKRFLEHCEISLRTP